MAHETTPIAATLDAIAADLPMLRANAHAAAHGSSAISIGSAASGEKLPGGTAAISLLAEVRTLLAFWCAVVLEERSETYQLGSGHLDASDETSMCTWLQPHADWLDAHPDGLLADEELDDVSRRIAALVRPEKIRRPQVGQCPEPECAGIVRAEISGGDGTDPALEEARDLTCDVQPEHRWDRENWRWLGRLMGAISEEAPEYMNSPDLAAWMSTRFSRTIKDWQIRKWAEREPITLAYSRAHKGYSRIDFARWYIEQHGAIAGRAQRTGTLGQGGAVMAGYGW